MIADKVSQEGRRLCRTGILRDYVNAIRFFVEAISRTVNMLRTPFHLHAHRALEHVADDRTRMAMWRGRSAGRIGHLDGRDLQVGLI